MSIGLIYFRRCNCKFSTPSQRLAHLGTRNSISEIGVGYQTPPRSWDIWGPSAWADFQLSADGFATQNSSVCDSAPAESAGWPHIQDEGGQLCPCGEPKSCVGKAVEWGEYIQGDSSRISKEQLKTPQRTIYEIPKQLWGLGSLIFQLLAAAYTICMMHGHAVLSSFGSQQLGPARPAYERIFKARSKWWEDPGKNSTEKHISLHFSTYGSIFSEVGEPFPPWQSRGVTTPRVLPGFSFCISAPWLRMWRGSPSHCWKHVLSERTPGVLPANCSQMAFHFVGLFSAWLGCYLCPAEVVPYGAHASTSVCLPDWATQELSANDALLPLFSWARYGPQ